MNLIKFIRLLTDCDVMRFNKSDSDLTNLINLMNLMKNFLSLIIITYLQLNNKHKHNSHLVQSDLDWL